MTMDDDTRICRVCAEEAGIRPASDRRSAGYRLDGWFYRSTTGAACAVCGNMIGPCHIEQAEEDKSQQLITVGEAEVCNGTS